MRRVLITGCSRGLGKHLMNHFDLNDCEVFRHTRQPLSGKNQLAGDINADNFCDNLEAIVEANQIEVFVNNAAIHSPRAFLEYSEADIKDVLNTNLVSQILMIQRVYRIFKKRNKGTIVNINSLAGRGPSANETVYCASKYGLRGFSESLQIESIGTDIKILDFYPGAMKTGMCKNRSNYDDLMDPDEVAETIVNIVLKERTTILPTETIIRRFLSGK